MAMVGSRRAIIFGGAGFIGRHLAAALLARGYGEVVSVDVTRPAKPLDGVRYVVHDLRTRIPPDLSGHPVDEVYNLAAVHRTPGHEDGEYFATNVPGARHVCDYCRETGVRALVFTSSIAVYGPAEAAKDEQAQPAPTSAYGRSKLDAEDIHRAWCDEDEAHRLVIVRPAAIFGPGEGGNFTRLARALKRRAFVFPGRRDTVKSCGHVGELVRSIDFALELDRKYFLYNFCYPTPSSIDEICRAFHRVAGYARPRLVAPFAMLMMIARGAELLGRLGLQTGIHRDRVKKLVQSTHIRPTALIDAGYTYGTDLEEGLRSWRDADASRELV